MNSKSDHNCHSACLICCTSIPTNSAQYKLDFEDAVFVLKILLNIPAYQLEGYLETGVKLEQEVTLCPSCVQIVSEARTLYADLVEGFKRFRGCQWRVWNSIQDGYQGPDEERLGGGLQNDDGTSSSQNTANKCRQIVVKNISKGMRAELIPFLPEDWGDLAETLQGCYPSPEEGDQMEGSPTGFASDHSDSEIKEEIISEVDSDSEDKNTNVGHNEEDSEWEPEMDTFSDGDNADDDDGGDKEEDSGTTGIRDGGQVSNEDNLKCGECGKVLKTNLTLQRHMFNVHNVPLAARRPYRKVKRASRVTEILSASELETLKCDLCQNKFKSPHFLRYHRKIVHEKLYRRKCDLCEKWYTKPCDLKRHYQNVHSVMVIGKDAYQCTVTECEKKRLSGREETISHQQTFHKRIIIRPKKSEKVGRKEVRIFTCQFCGKIFKEKYNLQQHEMLHTNKESKPFICEICGKGFANNHNLHYHKVYTHKVPTKKRNLQKSAPEKNQEHPHGKSSEDTKLNEK